MGNIIKTVFADQRKALEPVIQEQVRKTAEEVMALLQQANGMEQQLVQLQAAGSINSAIGNKQAVDQVEQQSRMLSNGIDKAYLLMADKLGMKV